MLLVLRHARTAWNVPPRRCQGQLDVPLSAEGFAEAARLGASLPCPDAAYASHLSRALGTARAILEVVAARTGSPQPPLTVERRLAEADCGSWQGSPHPELARAHPDLWRALASGRLDFAFPGGERLGDVLARFTEALEELDAGHRCGLALVVAHGGPMRLYLRSRGLVSTTEPGTVPANLGGFRLDGGALELLPPG